MSLNDMLDEEDNKIYPWSEDEMVDWMTSRPTSYRIQAMNILRRARASNLDVHKMACMIREKYEAEEAEIMESQREPFYVTFSKFMQGWNGIPTRNYD